MKYPSERVIQGCCHETEDCDEPDVLATNEQFQTCPLQKFLYNGVQTAYLRVPIAIIFIFFVYLSRVFPKITISYKCREAHSHSFYSHYVDPLIWKRSGFFYRRKELSDPAPRPTPRSPGHPFECKMTSGLFRLSVANGDFKVRIGMEVHAQIMTASKMFCACSTEFNASPNVHTCPVCLGYPGSLPVLNGLAVEKALVFATAVGATITESTVLERKNYTYPDLPKGFQISQYRVPLARRGKLRFWVRDRLASVALRRIQIEEDTARMIHLEDRTLLDFNRAGVPLMEIVSEPDLHSADEAVAFLLELRNVLRVLKVCDGNLEQGSLRAEPNVSIVFGGQEFPRVELKNLGSVRTTQQAIQYEVERQMALARKGQRWSRETRGFDEKKGTTYPLRLKESEEDYRYFPEPDLPPLVVTPEMVARVSRDLPELPSERRWRWQESLMIPAAQAQVLISDPMLADFFEGVVKTLGNRAKELGHIAANWVAGDLLGHVAESGGVASLKFAPAEIARMTILVADGDITGKAAKTVLMKLVDHGLTTDHWVRVLGLSKSKDESEILGWVQEALASESAALASYLSGKESAFKALMGAVMRISRGRADPETAKRVLLDALKNLSSSRGVVSRD